MLAFVLGDPLKSLLIVGDELIKKGRQLRERLPLHGDMRRVRKQLLAVPDKLAKTAEPQLLTQPHNGGGRNKCRLRQLAHRDIAHQQRMLREVGEDAILRAGQ